MSFNVARWRPAPLAPRSTGWGLWLAVMALTFLAATASILTVAGIRAMLTARAEWSGTLTVAALGRGLETSDAAATRVEDLLKRQRGVAAITVQDPSANDPLLNVLMGASGQGTQAPRFLTVRAAPASKLSQNDLSAYLTAQGLTTRWDDHRTWSAPVERAALIAAGASAALLAFTLLAFAALAIHAARLGVRRVGGRMSLLRSLGATPGFLAAQFPGKIGASALIGSLLGAVLAVAGVWWGADRFAHVLTVGLGLDGWDYPVAAAWPLIAGLTAWICARLGAGGALRRIA